MLATLPQQIFDGGDGAAELYAAGKIMNGEADEAVVERSLAG